MNAGTQVGTISFVKPVKWTSFARNLSVVSPYHDATLSEQNFQPDACVSNVHQSEMAWKKKGPSDLESQKVITLRTCLQSKTVGTTTGADITLLL